MSKSQGGIVSRILKRYFIDAMGSMAYGLFASLIIGTIIGQIGTLTGLQMLSDIAATLKSSQVYGAAIGVAIAWGLKCDGLVIFAAAGAAAIGCVAGGPVGAYLGGIIGAELGQLVSKKTPVDIIVTPFVAVVAGGAAGLFAGPYINKFMLWLGELINAAVELMPLPMGTLVGVIVGMVLTLPISSAALCVMLGLDGLAAGVSSISAIAMLVISCILGDPAVAVVTAALAGSIFGFLPYNFNPAKIFMGDTGSNFLGFILATLSIQGLFKFYAVISFAVPFLILGLPLFDMLSSIIRRVAKGQSPMAPDRGHIHHRLMDMGLSQKQAVAVLYAITCILGITGVILASSGAGKAILLLLAVILVCTIGFNVLAHSGKKGQGDKTEENSSEAETSDADNAVDMVEVTDQAEEKAENEEKTE